jgi:hypothetical protein
MTLESILQEIKKDKNWILKVIESCDSVDQLKCCYNIVKSWSSKIKFLIDDYDCPFYKYKDIKKIRSIYILAKDNYYSEIDKRIVERSNI